MPPLVFADQIMLIIIAAVVGFLTKALWDFFNSKAANKGLFMSKASCKAIRDDCGIKKFKEEYTKHRDDVIAHSAKIDQQLCSIEKGMAESRVDTKVLRSDITEIKETLSGLLAVMGMRKKDSTGRRGENNN